MSNGKDLKKLLVEISNKDIEAKAASDAAVKKDEDERAQFKSSVSSLLARTVRKKFVDTTKVIKEHGHVGNVPQDVKESGLFGEGLSYTIMVNGSRHKTFTVKVIGDYIAKKVYIKVDFSNPNIKNVSETYEVGDVNEDVIGDTIYDAFQKESGL